MMKMLLLVIFGVLSFVCNIYFICRARKSYKAFSNEKRVLSAVHLYTVGLFIAIVLLYIPLYYTSYYLGDNFGFVRPVLLSVYSALKVFILGENFDFIKTALYGQPDIINVLYTFYGIVLFIVAPVMTFTNVLSLFENIKGEIRFWFCKGKKIYIFSELNQKSVTLAKSIRDKNKKDVLVFTDVFEQNKEYDYELITRVHNFNAICLKRDIVHLNISAKKGDVELFLISENETENISQAIELTSHFNKLNKKYNVKIFVFSKKESSAYILDSVNYDNLLKHASANNYADSTFKLRRVNEIRQLAWNTVPAMNVFEIANANSNTISVLIVGAGSYGMEFFKTLLWFCQFDGYKVKITIVDKLSDGEDGKRSIKSIINHQCPGILEHNRSEVDGEAHYDIEILSGIDMTTASFEEILLYTGDDEEKRKLAQRIRETNIAIVSLGDDDLNIETAVNLRGLFDRAYSFEVKRDIPAKQEKLQIYSIVYDDQKSGILQNNDVEQKAYFLHNHSGVPYNIHFIGGMSNQLDYEKIYDKSFEQKSYVYHLQWVEITKRILEEQNKKAELESFKSEYDKPEKRDEEKRKYEKHEYYRLSSMAKALYTENVRKTLESLVDCEKIESKDKIIQTCMCPGCVRRKKSEHMRWNAYMRSMGYTYKNGLRADRAKLHKDLVSWYDLSDMDKLKD